MRAPGTRLALAVAAVLGALTLGSGFLLDDYFHLIVGGGAVSLPAGGPLDLYTFLDGDPDHTRAMVDLGPYPWWTDPEVRVAFWRPLASLSALLDQRLFGARAPGHHLQSALWYLAVVGAAAALLRRALPTGAAGWALLLFALDEAHAHTVGWIANRNALIAAAAGFWGLACHLRWREEGWGPGRWRALTGLGLGLAAGEVGVGMFGYLLAYEALAAPGGWRERVRALAPALGLALAWLVVHGALGYGASGSGAYLDPRDDPGLWLARAPGHALALLGGLLVNAPIDLWAVSEAARGPLVAPGALAALLGALWLGRAWPGLDAEARRGLSWLLPGALLSMVPTLSVFPMARLLMLPSLGAAALLGVALTRLLAGPRGRPLARAGLAGLVLLHLVIPPLAWAGLSVGLGAVSRWYESRALSAEVDDARVARQRVWILTAPDPVVAYYGFATRGALGHPLPASQQTLSLAPCAHALRRVAVDTLELEALGCELLTTPLETLFRSPARPLPEGAVARVAGAEIEVRAVGAQGPRVLRVRFGRPLEDPSLLLLTWGEGGLERLRPLSLGEERTLPMHVTPLSAR